MIINMLRAVNKMLDYKGTDKATTLPIRVDCAKAMLEEIIKGMESRQTTTLDESTVHFKETTFRPDPEKPRKPRTEPEPDPNAGKWAITAKGGKLHIAGYPPTGKVKVDGKVMLYKDAEGKPFTRCTLL